MKTSIARNPLLKNIIKEISDVAGYLWEKGWAERNAGNISVNISNADVNIFDTDFEKPEKLSRSYPLLGNNFIIITGTGTRMRDVRNKPLENLFFLRISADGEYFSRFNITGKTSHIKPSSELPSHLAIQEMLCSLGRKEKVVVHTHPDDLISLTHIREFCDEERINNMLWSMQPETCVFVNDGVGFVPYLLTGSEKIAQATIKALEKHRVILWEKHGCMAIGETPDEAFDLLDIVNKSASIFLTCKKAGYEAEGISKKDLDELRKVFNIPF